jgi:hypothetical protein
MRSVKGHPAVHRVAVFLLAAVLSGSSIGCRSEPQTASGEGGWLQGTADEKFEVIARQLRGFDVAMVETGYRYQQLYWAGEDQNWGYADYHLKKIQTAIQHGLERRPKRAKSAETFLTIVMPALNDAIVQQDQARFRERFGALTSTCNSCHVAEQVPFIHIDLPKVRSGPAQ